MRYVHTLEYTKTKRPRDCPSANLINRILFTLCKVAKGDVAENIEASLLHRVDEVDEGAGGAGVVDQ